MEGMVNEGRGRRWLRRQFEPPVVRRRTHFCALIASVAFAFVILVVVVRPGFYAVGPLVIGLDSLRNPFIELVVAVTVAVLTARRPSRLNVRFPRAVLAVWRAWPVGGRVFAVVLALKLAMTIVALGSVADDYFAFHRHLHRRFDEPLEKAFARNNRYRQFELFFERCRLELPADARVLYVGRGEGHLLSYVLYPRPVFMHPDDRYLAWVGSQALDLGWPIPEDELFPASFPPPGGAPALDVFVGSRDLNYRVTFVQSDLPASRIEAIR